MEVLSGPPQLQIPLTFISDDFEEKPRKRNPDVINVRTTLRLGHKLGA